MVHLAVFGVGRVGRPTTYTLLCERLFDEISVVDVKLDLARAFSEELKHVAASLNVDVKVNSFERDDEVSGADIVIVTAGYPRTAGVKMDRRDLAFKNGEIIRGIAETVPKRNRGAKYIIVTNPVDAMATLFQKISGEKFVISTGAHVDSLRLRSKLAGDLNVPVSRVEGFVGGEHGRGAVILWSTIKVFGKGIEEYLETAKLQLNRMGVEKYVKNVSKFIVDSIGGTEIGPATAFRDIVRAIAKNSGEILSIAAPMRFDLPEPVHVSVPVRVGERLELGLFNALVDEERKKIVESAWRIYETYQSTLQFLGLR